MVIMAGSTQIGQCILDCAQSGMQCNFNYLQCLGGVGPEF